MLKDTYKALNDHKTQKNIISAKKYTMYYFKLEHISKILDSVGMCNTIIELKTLTPQLTQCLMTNY